MRRFFGITALALCACASPAAKTFDISALKPTVEADQKALTGWFQLSGGFREFRLYPSKSDVGKTSRGSCISGIALSLAGVPTTDFHNRLMTVTGSIHGAGSPEAGSTPDTCGSGMVLLAMDISVPE
jgi:hypothetical protein